MAFLGPGGEESKGADQRERLAQPEGMHGGERWLAETVPLPLFLYS